MSDRFSSFTPGLESPASFLQDVTPDDANDLPVISRALNVATAGTVRVTTSGGDTATVTIVASVRVYRAGGLLRTAARRSGYRETAARIERHARRL